MKIQRPKSFVRDMLTNRRTYIPHSIYKLT